MSTRIVFRKANDNEVRIYDADGDHVGDVIRQRDILCPSSSHFIIHMNEDPRGFVRVHEHSRVRETAQRLLDTHPLPQ